MRREVKDASRNVEFAVETIEKVVRNENIPDPVKNNLSNTLKKLRECSRELENVKSSI